ncbi:MAG: S53 family peptidase, partial [Acidimicrobiales bacterium]
MALRRWLAGCAAGAALAATGLLAGPGVPAAAGAPNAPGPAVTRGAAAPPARSGIPAEDERSTACSPVPVGYSACLVDLLQPGPGALPRPAGHVGPKSAPGGLSPNAIATAYGFSTTGGSGSTLAIVDAYGDPTITSDLAAFSTQYDLRPCTTSNHCLTTVDETGGASAAPAPRGTTGWGLEASMDVEWAHALAPDADILLVEATSNSDTDLFAAVRYAAARAQYVTMAWGGTEFAGETALDAAFADPSVSYFAAVGDTASDVLYPATSPDVIAVGGTTLTVTGATGAWESETAWATAGGGCSQYETAAPAQAGYPSYDQQGAGCAGRRAVPDISLDANPSTGVAVYDTDGESGWLVAGGTSASADMVAAHAAETGAHVDATFVYTKLQAYNVATGSNGHPCEKGYNLCTGLGSWNDAVGSVHAATGAGSGGALEFSSGAQDLTAGTWSGPVT